MPQEYVAKGDERRQQADAGIVSVAQEVRARSEVIPDTKEP